MLGEPSYFYLVPLSAIESLHCYVLDGVPTGGCLRAALENNFVEFHLRADEDFTLGAKWIAGYLYDEIPLAARGDKKKVEKWIKSGGLNGQARKAEKSIKGGNKR